MGKHINYKGRTIGIWKVLEKTDKRDQIGRVYYCVKNTLTDEKMLKTSNFLAQVIKYNCKSTKVGRPKNILTGVKLHGRI